MWLHKKRGETGSGLELQPELVYMNGWGMGSFSNKPWGIYWSWRSYGCCCAKWNPACQTQHQCSLSLFRLYLSSIRHLKMPCFHLGAEKSERIFQHWQIKKNAMKRPRFFCELSDLDIVILAACAQSCTLLSLPGLYSSISTSHMAPVNPARFVLADSPGVRRQALLLVV